MHTCVPLHMHTASWYVGTYTFRIISAHCNMTLMRRLRISTCHVMSGWVIQTWCVQRIRSNTRLFRPIHESNQTTTSVGWYGVDGSMEEEKQPQNRTNVEHHQCRHRYRCPRGKAARLRRPTAATPKTQGPLLSEWSCIVLVTPI